VQVPEGRMVSSGDNLPLDENITTRRFPPQPATSPYGVFCGAYTNAAE